MNSLNKSLKTIGNSFGINKIGSRLKVEVGKFLVNSLKIPRIYQDLGKFGVNSLNLPRFYQDLGKFLVNSFNLLRIYKRHF